MVDEPSALRRIEALPVREREPNSARTLDAWINQAQERVGVDHGRLGWLVASTVVVAVLQRAVDESNTPNFLLKGGTYLQHRLDWAGRSTKDVDGIVRGDIDAFLAVLDRSLREPWGVLTLSRSRVELINVPTRARRLGRFEVKVALRGVVWRSVKVEISPDEAGIGDHPYPFSPPSLSHFGLPNPDALVGIALRFQIAQKFHACSDPHDPPQAVNDRPRDLVDLILLRALLESDVTTTAGDLRAACVALFDARAAEAIELGRTARSWPPVIQMHRHWPADYERAARDARLADSLVEAIAQLNSWISDIETSPETKRTPR
jgi:hypothetical protein